MTDSKCETHPALTRLVTDIVADFENNARPSDNYVARRLDLISEMGVDVLADVDEQLWASLKSAEIADDQLRQRVVDWAHVFKTHAG